MLELFICFLIWLSLAFISKILVEKDVRRKGRITSLVGYSRCVQCLEWFEDREPIRRRSKWRWVAFGPIESIVYFTADNKDKVEAFDSDLAALQRRLEQIRAARYQSGKVWLHPLERGLWRERYGMWYYKCIGPSLKKTSLRMRYNMSKAVKTVKKSQPCVCIDPRFSVGGDKYSYCTEGHVLPRDAVKLIE